MVFEEAVVIHGIEAKCASPNGIEAKCASPRWRPNPEIDWYRDRYPRDMINPAGRNHVNRQRSTSSNAIITSDSTCMGLERFLKSAQHIRSSNYSTDYRSDLSLYCYSSVSYDQKYDNTLSSRRPEISTRSRTLELHKTTAT